MQLTNRKASELLDKSKPKIARLAAEDVRTVILAIVENSLKGAAKDKTM